MWKKLFCHSNAKSKSEKYLDKHYKNETRGQPNNVQYKFENDEVDNIIFIQTGYDSISITLKTITALLKKTQEMIAKKIKKLQELDYTEQNFEHEFLYLKTNIF
jgi:hypothetical protein